LGVPKRSATTGSVEIIDIVQMVSAPRIARVCAACRRMDSSTTAL